MGTMKRKNNVTGEMVDIGEIKGDKIFGEPYLCVYGKNEPKHTGELFSWEIAGDIRAYVRFKTTNEVNEMINNDAKRMGFDDVELDTSISCTKGVLEALGFTEESLIDKVMERLWNEEYTCRPISEFGYPEISGKLPCVVSCYENVRGAAIIASNVALREIYKKLGKFYVIPSSIHEIIVVPESMGMPMDYMKWMVEEVNRTVVEEQDVLSDKLFYYNGTSLLEK